jgi:hypothetical protein
MLSYINGIDVLSSSAIELLFIYYFAGVIISRFGSIVVEPISIKLGVVKYASHHDL